MAGLPAQPAAYSRRVPAGSRREVAGTLVQRRVDLGSSKVFQVMRGPEGGRDAARKMSMKDDWLYEADGSARYLQEENVVSAVGC